MNKKTVFFITKIIFIVVTILAQDQVVLKMDFQIDARYLNLPVKNEQQTQRVCLTVAGKIIREFDLQLAESKPDFWVFIDLQDHKGSIAKIQLETPSKGLDLIYLSDAFAGADSLYQESLRPQFHFTSQRGWNNDPNGLVWHNGEYHLYYQHNPFGWSWGNMHWGHAVSPDLIHWKELPTALKPPTYQDMAFSGSAVVDKQNTSGFSKDGIVPLVAAFTSTGRGECISYSLDNGRTFTEYENNPVLKHVGRDPKVFWYEPGEHWVMVVYDEKKKVYEDVQYDERTLQIYTSSDFKKWEYQSENRDFFECPELFELEVDGDPKNTKWIMYGGNGQYLIGGFDGKVFIPETPRYELHHGNFYASQTYNNTPDGRRIQIGWGSGIESRGMPFNQLMLFPTELTLSSCDDGLRMLPKPIREIELLHKKKHEWRNVLLSKDNEFSTGIKQDILHIVAEFEILDNFVFGLVINGFEIKYDAQNYQLNKIFMRPIDNQIKLEILVDRTCIEIFGNDGRVYIPKAHVATEDQLDIKTLIDTPGWQGQKRSLLKHLVVYELESIW